jgi:hypothetical protein
MFKKKQEEPVISFVTLVPGLETFDDIKPQPSSKFIPKWWKDIPNNKGSHDETQNIKMCPSFPDYFSQGYIIPMWADTLIKYDKGTAVWSMRCGRSNEFAWEFHPDSQFIDYATPSFLGKDAYTVLKAISPWKIITKPGWSVMQVPLHYHFENKFSVMPGIIHTDIYHDINQQVLVHDKDVEIFIKRGDPFVQYVPFKREEVTHDVRFRNGYDYDMFNLMYTNLSTKFIGNGAYRSLFKKNK